MVSITHFLGRHNFLSNFYEVPVEFNGLLYRNTEAAYQAQKSLDPAVQVKFVTMAAGNAKRAGKKIAIRDDWDEVKIKLMTQIVHAKFDQNADIRKKLLETVDAELIEGNWWGDRFWGVCDGQGENHLGKILMDEREYWNNLPR